MMIPKLSPKRSRLPMIVDVAVDTEGGQLYQVHDSDNRRRELMPKPAINEKLMNKQYGHEGFEVNEGGLNQGGLNQGGLNESGLNEGNGFERGESQRIKSELTPSSQMVRHEFPRDTETWLVDVEFAFREVLGIIPKNGLSKIKISGKTCGRNELISDYIYMKTGKLRTRKQISSHLQVIKNLGQNKSLIKLINDGPPCENAEEYCEIKQRFETIFSKISMEKSLGMSMKRSNSDSGTKGKRSKVPDLILKNFQISLFEPTSLGFFYLSAQRSNKHKSCLIKPHSNYKLRFPILNTLNEPHVQIIHGMVRICPPESLYEYLVKDHLQASFSLGNFNLSGLKNYSMFSSVYSSGSEVLKIAEEVRGFDPQPFLPNFWKFYFQQFIHRPRQEICNGLANLTICQILSETLDDAKPTHESGLIRKQNIVAVLLWEFAAVKTSSEAFTTFASLNFPSGAPSAPISAGPRLTPAGHATAPAVPQLPQPATQVPQTHPTAPAPGGASPSSLAASVRESVTSINVPYGSIGLSSGFSLSGASEFSGPSFSGLSGPSVSGPPSMGPVTVSAPNSATSAPASFPASATSATTFDSACLQHGYPYPPECYPAYPGGSPDYARQEFPDYFFDLIN